MNTPEWLKPGIYGALMGAAFVSVVGFSWGGWVTDGTASDRAMTMSRNDVVASMVPVCLDMARSDPARVDKLEMIRATATYQRRDALMTAGWATVPGTDAPNRDIAQACLKELDL
jgi:alpha/beta superfamily hydrolase